MAGKPKPGTQPIDPNTIATPSNAITMVRIILVPIFVAILLSPWPEWFGFDFITSDFKRLLAVIIFIIISCTDWLDGYLARSRNEVTNFGKFADPLADKILVVAALVSLVELDALPSWVVLIIIAREFIVSGVRMMAAKDGVVIAASYWGKFKTVFTMIAIVLFTIKDSHMVGSFGDVMADGFYIFSWVIMIIALALTVISMVDYVYKARELFGFSVDNKADKSGKPEKSKSPVIIDSALAERVIKKACQKGVTLGTAESLTGGLIAATLTSVSGSSSVVRGGVVSYVNEVKNAVLAVDADVLSSEGAVCSEVAEQMAQGARTALKADICVSVTGIAGPTGAEPGKPIGTVYMGLSTSDGTSSNRFNFEGTRDEVRNATVNAALAAFEEQLNC